MVTTVRIAGTDADPCSIVLPMQVLHGRAGTGAQPDPPQASVIWDGPDCPWKVGDSLEIWEGAAYTPATYDSPTVLWDDRTAVYDDDGTGQVNAPRFIGTIAGIKANSRYGAVQSWDIEAVGKQARLGFLPVTLTRPQESDIARVQALCAAVSTPVRVIGNVSLTLAAGAVDRDLLGALHEVCESTGGVLWQAMDGTLCYGTADHREALPDPVGVLPCEVINEELEWDSAVEQIVNSVSVSWGPEGAQESATHTDTESTAMSWGVRHIDLRTKCAGEADAEQLGLLILARRAWPYWGQSSVFVPLDDDMPADTSRLVSRLDIGSPLLVPIPPVPGPTPDELAPVVVEGWVQVWDIGETTVQLSVSDQRRWVATQRRDWAEVRDGGTWDFWNDGSWLDMLVKGPTP